MYVFVILGTQLEHLIPHMASFLVALPACATLLRWQKLSTKGLLHFLTCAAPTSSTSVALGRAGAAETKEEDTVQPHNFSRFSVDVSGLCYMASVPWRPQWPRTG